MVDLNRKVATRDGREVRIYSLDSGNSPRTVHGAIKGLPDGVWRMAQWTPEGNFLGFVGCTHNNDLVNPVRKVTREGWVNVYAFIRGDYVHESKEAADRGQSPNRLACVHIQYEVELPA